MSLSRIEQVAITLPRLNAEDRRQALWRYNKSELLCLGREFGLPERYLLAVEQTKSSWRVSDQDELIQALLVAVKQSAAAGVQLAMFE
jgi:hypothetical protein